MSTNIGKYKLQERLGHGGMAEVWRAFDTELKRNVAIKLLRTDLHNDWNLLALFKQEAQVIASLDHPNIVPIHDSGISRPPEESCCYIVMKYVEGQTLANYIHQTSRQYKMPPLDDIIHLFKTIGSAVDHAHEKNVIHRDIKPANILLDKRRLNAIANPQDGLGEPILCDFGIAKLLETTARTPYPRIGTPDYISPEQAAGLSISKQSDIYSLAVILYEIFTAQVPFQGEDAASVRRQHIRASPIPPSSRNRDVSPSLSAVILRGLAKKPEERFASANELAEALEGALRPSAPVNLFGSLPINPLFEVDALKNHITPSAALLASADTEPSAHLNSSKEDRPNNSPSNPPSTPRSEIDAPKETPTTSPAYAAPTATEPPISHSPPSTPSTPRPPVYRKPTERAFIISIIAVLLSGIVLVAFIYVSGFGHVTPTPTTTLSLPSSIGVVQAPDGETIGISDGTYVFDTDSTATNLKKMAAQKLRQGDIGSAFPLLSEAHDENTSDAEALIYHENLRLRIANVKYITIVLGTTLTGGADPLTVGHDDLQAAYLAQRAYNDTADQHGGVSVRLLIANLGSLPSYASAVTDQITRLAQQDKTIVGTMGWTQSALALASVSLLDRAHIPMVSMAAGDNLTSISPYFFRITAVASMQGGIAAQYATKTLKAKSVAVFVDNANDYSHSLAQGFRQSFTGSLVATEDYTLNDSVNDPQRLVNGLQDALQHHPDIIYFAGYSNDASILLQRLKPSDPLVLGGNALYRFSYEGVTSSELSHLRFTSPAYPDEWDIMGLAARKPPFFQDYPQTFGDGNPQHRYGFTRADGGTMLSYDAIDTLLQASKLALQKTYPITTADVRDALATINGNNAFQGITGLISFQPDSNITNRALTVVCNQDGHFKMEMIVGQFLLNEPVSADYPTRSACA